MYQLKKAGKGSDKSRFPLRVSVCILLIMWTSFVAVEIFWHISHERDDTLEMAQLQANDAIDEDLLYRRWVSSHGGVYAPATEQTPPNPHLFHITERDVTTPSGRILTLINPA